MVCCLHAAPLSRRPTTPPMTSAIPKNLLKFSRCPKNKAPRMTIPTPATDVQMA